MGPAVEAVRHGGAPIRPRKGSVGPQPSAGRGPSSRHGPPTPSDDRHHLARALPYTDRALLGFEPQA